MKKILAVVVSIVWLLFIVGVPYMVLTGNAAQFLPASFQEQLTQLGVQGLLDGLGASTTPVSVAGNEPIVVMQTATPVSETEPEATPVPPPSPTPEPESTATPLPEPTTQPAQAEPAVSFPVAVRGQADLRTGPGMNFDSVGLVAAGATILISGQDETGGWFQLENGNWIVGEVLASKPPVPIVLFGQENATPQAADPQTPVAEVVATAAATPVVVRVNSDANLRSGPGSTFARVDGVAFNSDVAVVGKFVDDNWYFLTSGSWIFGAMFDVAPDVPLVNADGRPVGSAAPAATIPAAATPAPTTGITSTTPLSPPTASILANLRAAPNITAALVGSAKAGQVLDIVGKNAAGDWLKLASGSWIFAELVDNIPTNLPVVAEDEITSATATPTAATDSSSVAVTAELSVDPAKAIQALVAGITTQTTTISTTTTVVAANLRSGPGTTFALQGSLPAGAVLTIIGRNEAGDWLKLDRNVWVFAELVANIPENLPILTE